MIKFETKNGFVNIDEFGDGKRSISVFLSLNDNVKPANFLVTSYPISLIEMILNVKGPEYLCDEIRRDEDDSYIRQAMDIEILSYVSENDFAKKRILDFGCGCGSSSLVLARMFPTAEIVGCELLDEFVTIAKERARFYNMDKLKFFTSPDANHLPAEMNSFDYIILSAVFEHLLPSERPIILRLLWDQLKDGGILFIRETPYRYSPVESHTTGLPFINYLPERLAEKFAVRFSKHVKVGENWETLLRRGIRGGSEREIVKIISRNCGNPILLKPTKSGINNRIDLWSHLPTSKRYPKLKKLMYIFMTIIWRITGLTITPQLSLAIKKTSK